MRLLITAFLITIAATTSTFAHGGGLNSEGCHNNRKTGDYHCHRAPNPTPAPEPLYQQQPMSGDNGGAFANCTAARQAGAAPVYRGNPGYGSHLDRDNDGIGCE
jgi:hypothetical protein